MRTVADGAQTAFLAAVRAANEFEGFQHRCHDGRVFAACARTERWGIPACREACAMREFCEAMPYEVKT